MYDLTAVGKQIKHYRKKLGLTQSELAARLNVSFQAVSSWEKAAVTPDLQNICALALVFRIPVDALLNATTAGEMMLAVDGGGTKSEFVLFTADGTIHKRFLLAGTNASTYGLDSVVDTLCQGIDACLKEQSGLRTVFIGTAGGMLSQLQDTLSRRYPQLHIAIESDGVNAVYMDETAQAALICGTGSILILREPTGIRRLGGWGYMLGDPGSGFSFGQKLLQRCIRYEDGVGGDPNLYEAVCKKLNRNALRHPSLAWTTASVASFAGMFLELCRAGDQEALRFLETEMQQLAERINTACPAQSRVALCGGLFGHFSDLLLPALQRHTRQDITYFQPTLPPVYGACIRCCELAKLPRGQNFTSNFSHSMIALASQF